jgi:hypothetical protein
MPSSSQREIHHGDPRAPSVLTINFYEFREEGDTKLVSLRQLSFSSFLTVSHWFLFCFSVSLVARPKKEKAI